MADESGSNSNSDAKRNDWFQYATHAAGLLAGIATLVYLTGAIVMALRLAFERLPWASVVSQLPREFLISIGAGQVLLPALLVSVLYGLVQLFRDDVEKLLGFVRTLPRGPHWLANALKATVSWVPARARAVGAVVGGYLLVLALMAIPPACILLVRRLFTGNFELEAATAVAIGFSVLALFAFPIYKARSLLTKRSEKWRPPLAVFAIAAFYGAASIPSMVAAAASVPLTEARICDVDNFSEQGFLVGETSDRVYLGERSGHNRIAVIPFSKVSELFIGDDAEHATCEIVSTPPTASERLGIERRLEKGISNSFLLPENQTLEDPVP